VQPVDELDGEQSRLLDRLVAEGLAVVLGDLAVGRLLSRLVLRRSQEASNERRRPVRGRLLERVRAR